MTRPILHLSLPVRDLDAAVDFYRGVFGARVGRTNRRWTDVDFFGAQLTLQLDPEHVPEDPGSRHFGVTLPWAEWEALGADIRDRGVSTLDGPTVSLEGTDREQGKLYLADPSGNVIELKAYRRPDLGLGAVWTQ